MEFFLAINSFTKNQSSNDRFPSNKHRFFYEIQRILLLTCSTFKPLYPGAESDPQPSTRLLQPGQCIAFNPCGIVLRCDTVLERLVILGPLHHHPRRRPGGRRRHPPHRPGRRRLPLLHHPTFPSARPAGRCLHCASCLSRKPDIPGSEPPFASPIKRSQALTRS